MGFITFGGLHFDAGGLSPPSPCLATSLVISCIVERRDQSGYVMKVRGGYIGHISYMVI